MKGYRYVALTAAVTLAISCSLSGLAADTAKTSKETKTPAKKATTAPVKKDAMEPARGQQRSFTLSELAAMKQAATRPDKESINRANQEIRAALKHSSHSMTSISAYKPAAKPSKTSPKTVVVATHKSAVKSPVNNKQSQPEVITTTASKTTPTEESNVILTSASSQAARMVISAWLDKQGSTPRYKVGDKMVVNVTSSMDCNLVVFNYDSKGTLTQLFPNSEQPSGFVRSGESVQIGGPDSPFDYEVTGKGGMERIFVYAYPTNSSEQPITVAMNSVPNSPFRSIEMSYEKYRSLVNESRSFFSREVKIVPKRNHPRAVDGAALTSASKTEAEPGEVAPNKVELTFMVEN